MNFKKTGEKEEKYYQQIVDLANVAIIKFDTGFNLTDFAGNSEIIFGFKKEEVIGKSLYETIVPEIETSGRNLKEHLDELIVNIKSCEYHVNENTTKDGKKVWIQWYNSEIKNEQDALTGFLSIGMDVTERVKAEIALKESEERFKTLSNLTFEGILIHDNGIIIDCNLSFERQIGYTRAELIGMQLMDDLIPGKYKDMMGLKLMADLANYEVEAIHKDGTVIPISIQSKKTKIGDKYLKVAAIRDITETKRAFNELNNYKNQLEDLVKQRTEELKKQNDLLHFEKNLLRTLIDTIPDAIYIKDRESRFVTANKKTVQVMKAPDHQFIEGKTDFDFYEEEIARIFYNDEQQIIKSGKPIINKEEIGFDIEGRPRRISTSKVPCFDTKGEIFGIVGVGRDITEMVEYEDILRKQSSDLLENNMLLEERQEEIQQQSEILAEQNKILENERNLLRTIIDNIPDLIYIKDIDSRFLNANLKQIQHLKLDKVDDIIGKTDFDFYDSRYANQYYADEQSMIKTGQPVINKEELSVNSFHQEIYLSTTKVPLKDKKGKISGIVGIGRDITAQKMAENKLKTQARRLEETNILLSERAGKIEQLNEELFEVNDMMETANFKLKERKEELEATLEQLKKTQSHLVQAEKMASLGILMAGIAHEINNPVNFIYAGVNSIIRDFEDLKVVFESLNSLRNSNIDNVALWAQFDDLKQQYEFDLAFKAVEETLQDIKIGANRIKEIINGLSRFSRIETENWKKANIHEEIESVLILLKNKYKNHVQIIKNFDKTLPEVECFPGKLNQVFMNIISNAIDAIEEKQGQITINTAYTSNTVSISISDTGKGIKDEDKLKIFDPFYTTKEVGQGLGLGLSISYSIIQEHKGEIHVKSDIDKGTEFLIKIPILQSDNLS